MAYGKDNTEVASLPFRILPLASMTTHAAPHIIKVTAVIGILMLRAVGVPVRGDRTCVQT